MHIQVAVGQSRASVSDCTKECNRMIRSAAVVYNIFYCRINGGEKGAVDTTLTTPKNLLAHLVLPLGKVILLPIAQTYVCFELIPKLQCTPVLIPQCLFY